MPKGPWSGARSVDNDMLMRARSVIDSTVELDDDAQQYRDSLPKLPARQLLDELQAATRNNQYGSHAEMIAIIRDELLRRINA